MADKIRAYKLARELKMSNEKFLDFICEEFGVVLKSHMTRLNDAFANDVRKLKKGE